MAVNRALDGWYFDLDSESSDECTVLLRRCPSQEDLVLHSPAVPSPSQLQSAPEPRSPAPGQIATSAARLTGEESSTDKQPRSTFEEYVAKTRHNLPNHGPRGALTWHGPSTYTTHCLRSDEDDEADARALRIACSQHKEPAEVVFQRRCVSRRSSSSLEAPHAGHSKEAEPCIPSSEAAQTASPPITSQSTKQWPYSLSSRVGLVDTHCHLEFIFNKVGHRGSYARFRNQHRDTFPDCYEGCVANFCDPQTFKKRRMWEPILSEDGVWGAFGCHPHMAGEYSEEIDEQLIEALEHPKVVALGEIGLDYSRRNNCDHDQQKRVFRRQLQLALNGRLPLIIHSRESTPDTIGILKEMVPSNYMIHRHCFTADWPEAQQWLKEFPNLCLGLTPLVSFPNAGGLVEVARQIPLDRLLIETDAPYFLPKSESGRLKASHPGMAIHVATWVASLRKIEVDDILTAVRQNTHRIYKI